jgi:hypothetical protein
MNTFKHSGDLGDIIYALPTIKALGGGVLYLSEGATRVKMSEVQKNFITPLLVQQDYITGVEMWKGQAVAYDLDHFRNYWLIHGHEYGTSLAAWHARAFDLPLSILNEQWLKLPDYHLKSHYSTIIHRSPRYHNEHFPWRRVIDHYRGSIAFVGLRDEHEKFCHQFSRVPFMEVRDAFEMACWIDQAGRFIGNQSLPAAIAEGLKKTKIIETYIGDPNCIFERPDAQNVFTKNVYLP